MVFFAYTDDSLRRPRLMNPDIKGLMVALDAYAEIHPEFYKGHDTSIEAALTAFADAHPNATEKEVLSEYYKQCRNKNIQPLQNLSLAFIGGGPFFPEQVSALSGRFKNFKDIQKTRGTPLNPENAGRYTAKGQFDVVITGNALNDPRQDFPTDLFSASALLAKPDGLIAHIVGRNENYTDHILSHGVATVSGQELIGVRKREAMPEIGRDGLNPVYAIFCKPCKVRASEKPCARIDSHQTVGRIQSKRSDATPPL